MSEMRLSIRVTGWMGTGQIWELLDPIQGLWLVLRAPAGVGLKAFLPGGETMDTLKCRTEDLSKDDGETRGVWELGLMCGRRSGSEELSSDSHPWRPGSGLGLCVSIQGLLTSLEQKAGSHCGVKEPEPAVWAAQRALASCSQERQRVDERARRE